MKLYIKQRYFSVGDKYDVFNENGDVVYQIRSEIFTIGAKIHLMDYAGNELYYIRRRITFFLAEYEIYRGNTLCATISQELSFFRKRLTIQCDYGNLEIHGDFFAWDFDITNNGILIGSVSKRIMSWSDTYELAIQDGMDAAFFTSLVIAIDNCLHNEDK